MDAADIPEGEGSNRVVVVAGGDGELVVRGCLCDVHVVMERGGDDLRVKIGSAAEVLDIEEVLVPAGVHEVPFAGSGEFRCCGADSKLN